MARDIKTTTTTIPSPPLKMTYEEFLAWADEDTYAEWVDGEVMALSPASDRHQDLVIFLGALFRLFLEARPLGRAVIAPFQMKTGPDLPGREPDLLFVAREHLVRLKTNFLEGPADLAVEVISPDSRSLDRGGKFREYEQGGVREYWLIDDPRKQAEFYVRGEDGAYYPAPVGQDGIYQSAVVEGLWLKVDWLWQDPLPPLLSILKAWGLL